MQAWIDRSRLATMTTERTTLGLVLSRCFYGVLAGGLTIAILVGTNVTLAPAVVLAIGAAVGIAVAVFGPKLFELLLNLF